MADKLQKIISVFLSFVDGERPSAAKFNALVAQTRLGFEVLEKAIGDIHSNSWPYTANPNVSETFLTIPYGRTGKLGYLIDEDGGSDTDIGYGMVGGASRSGRPLDIINLARIIGPASNLNPQAITSGTWGGPRLISQESLSEFTGKREGSLRYPLLPSELGYGRDYLTNKGLYDETTNPIEPDAWSHPAGMSNPFVNYKSDPKYIKKAGDFHITLEGKFFTHTPLPMGCFVTYWTNPGAYAGGPNYAGATFNVMPDIAQATSGVPGAQLVITGPDAEGVYVVVLPEVTHQQKNYELDSAELEPGSDLNHYQQLKLPRWITESFSVGEVIPGNSIALKCITTNETYTDAVYAYIDPKTVQVSNVDLCDIDGGEASDRIYVLVTVGTDITTSIDDLRTKQFQHSHDRKYGEPYIDIEDISGQLKETPGSGVYVGSSIIGDYFPQYMHRDGWRAAIGDAPNTAASDQGVMRGSFIIGRRLDATSTEEEIITASYQTETNDSGGDKSSYFSRPGALVDGASHHLVFGGRPNFTIAKQPKLDYSYKNASLNEHGPQIYRANENDWMVDNFVPPVVGYENGSASLRFPRGASRLSHQNNYPGYDPDNQQYWEFLSFGIGDTNPLCASNWNKSNKDMTGGAPPYTWFQYHTRRHFDTESFWDGKDGPAGDKYQGALRIEGKAGHAPVQIWSSGQIRIDNSYYNDGYTFPTGTPQSESDPIVINSMGDLALGSWVGGIQLHTHDAWGIGERHEEDYRISDPGKDYPNAASISLVSAGQIGAFSRWRSRYISGTSFSILAGIHRNPQTHVEHAVADWANAWSDSLDRNRILITNAQSSGSGYDGATSSHGVLSVNNGYTHDMPSAYIEKSLPIDIYAAGALNLISHKGVVIKANKKGLLREEQDWFSHWNFAWDDLGSSDTKGTKFTFDPDVKRAYIGTQGHWGVSEPDGVGWPRVKNDEYNHRPSHNDMASNSIMLDSSTLIADSEGKLRHRLIPKKARKDNYGNFTTKQLMDGRWVIENYQNDAPALIGGKPWYPDPVKSYEPALDDDGHKWGWNPPDAHINTYSKIRENLPDNGRADTAKINGHTQTLTYSSWDAKKQWGKNALNFTTRILTRGGDYPMNPEATWANEVTRGIWNMGWIDPGVPFKREENNNHMPQPSALNFPFTQQNNFYSGAVIHNPNQTPEPWAYDYGGPLAARGSRSASIQAYFMLQPQDHKTNTTYVPDWYNSGSAMYSKAQRSYYNYDNLTEFKNISADHCSWHQDWLRLGINEMGASAPGPREAQLWVRSKTRILGDASYTAVFDNYTELTPIEAMVDYARWYKNCVDNWSEERRNMFFDLLDTRFTAFDLMDPSHFWDEDVRTAFRKYYSHSSGPLENQIDSRKWFQHNCPYIRTAFYTNTHSNAWSNIGSHADGLEKTMAVTELSKHYGHSNLAGMVSNHLWIAEDDHRISLGLHQSQAGGEPGTRAAAASYLGGAPWLSDQGFGRQGGADEIWNRYDQSKSGPIGNQYDPNDPTVVHSGWGGPSAADPNSYYYLSGNGIFDVGLGVNNSAWADPAEAALNPSNGIVGRPQEFVATEYFDSDDGYDPGDWWDDGAGDDEGWYGEDVDGQYFWTMDHIKFRPSMTRGLLVGTPNLSLDDVGRNGHNWITFRAEDGVAGSIRSRRARPWSRHNFNSITHRLLPVIRSAKTFYTAKGYNVQQGGAGQSFTANYSRSVDWAFDQGDGTVPNELEWYESMALAGLTGLTLGNAVNWLVGGAVGAVVGLVDWFTSDPKEVDSRWYYDMGLDNSAAMPGHMNTMAGHNDSGDASQDGLSEHETSMDVYSIDVGEGGRSWTNALNNGCVVFESGGADYAEYMPIGNVDEWEGFEVNIGSAIPMNGESSIFGLPPGMVVYIREGLIYKNGPGVPMVVSDQPMVIGNDNWQEANVAYDIVSFIGQLPVMVIGPVGTGDYIVPLEDGNICKAIPEDEISFQDYKKAIGTAFKSFDQAENVISHVLCAIGKK